MRPDQAETPAAAPGTVPFWSQLRYILRVPTFRIREAAELLGVSYDTMRRWAEAGRIEQITDASGRLAVDGAALARFAQERAEPGGYPDDGDHPVAAEPVRRPGHPGGPRHGDGPGGDPGRAAPVRVAAEPGGGRWARPGAGDAGRGRRQVDERIRGSPQEPLTLRSENRT